MKKHLPSGMQSKSMLNTTDAHTTLIITRPAFLHESPTLNLMSLMLTPVSTRPFPCRQKGYSSLVGHLDAKDKGD